MNAIVSVNVGLPRDLEWRGKTVRTAIRNEPVQGKVLAARLNLIGDGQADLSGHGGQQRRYGLSARFLPVLGELAFADAGGAAPLARLPAIEGYRLRRGTYRRPLFRTRGR